MVTALKILIGFVVVAVSFPVWCPAMMWLFGMTIGLLGGLLGATLGLLSAFFALAIVGGVLMFFLALPALVVLAMVGTVIFARTRRPHAG